MHLFKSSNKEIKNMNIGKVGAPFRYSDGYVQFLAFLKIGFKIPQNIKDIVLLFHYFLWVAIDYVWCDFWGIIWDYWCKVFLLAYHKIAFDSIQMSTSTIFISSLQYEMFSAVTSVKYLRFMSLLLAARNDFLTDSMLMLLMDEYCPCRYQLFN